MEKIDYIKTIDGFYIEELIKKEIETLKRYDLQWEGKNLIVRKDIDYYSQLLSRVRDWEGRYVCKL